MTTLTQASIASRKGVRYIIYSIIIFIIARMLLLIGIATYKKIFPPAPTPANVAFGKLTKIQFPERNKHQLNFSLETADGSLPTFSNLANVYFMPKTLSNLLSLDFAKENASKLGFNEEPQQASESIYRFSHKSTAATLEMNIINQNFSISYDFNLDPNPLSMHPTQPEIAFSSIKSFLGNADLMPEELSGPVMHSYLKTQGGELVPAVSLSDANLIRIDLFRKNYNDLPVLTNTPNKANVWFLVSGINERGKEIVAGEYHFFPADSTKFATYPIKTSAVAWQELLNGNYFPASLGTTKENESIKIRKVYLAYYDSGLYSEFLQPIYVFEGDKDFVGYVPAITDENY